MVCSVMGAGRIPGIKIVSLAFKMLRASDLRFTALIAADSSEDVK
jgi:hypothetical protein